MFVKPRRSDRDNLFAGGPLALVFLEVALADTDALGSDLDQLVAGGEFDRILKRQRDRRGQQDRVVLAGGADIGELLGLDRVDHQIVLAAVDPDDDALVELVAGAYEQPSALLQRE